ncbi:MAG: hypothetical protein PHY09_16375 [Desulfuromonadaceae bacterium]|nr:hypothetical protein [Desulfuromonadaceae bacterium]MDD5106423.1 hypothetical protein [Desulfuromonadaceae bacterium]
MICGFCGFEFDESDGKHGCGGCSGGCHNVHCPRCNYKNPAESGVAKKIRGIFEKYTQHKGEEG